VSGDLRESVKDSIQDGPVPGFTGIEVHDAAFQQLKSFALQKRPERLLVEKIQMFTALLQTKRRNSIQLDTRGG
jgi:hypothetical protein